MPRHFPKELESINQWFHILNNLRMLRRNTWLSYSELQKMQLKRLRGILEYAYENVAFYHQRFDKAKVKPDHIKSTEDLLKIPTLTKSEVQRNFNSLISEGTEIKRCTKQETSGSTGTPLTIIADKKGSYIAAANKLRHYVENGGRLFRDKYVLLLPTRRPPSIKRTRLGSVLEHLGILESVTMNTRDPIQDVFDRLAAFKPDAIDALPSFLLLLAREIEKRGNLIRPRLVFSSGELLDAMSRKMINSAFGVEMFDVYGCTEAGNIAWECSEHTGYHMNIDLMVTEFVKDNEHVAAGETGKVVLTPFWNHAMPLIRYEIGDIGILGNKSCTCGRGLPLMKILEGRSDDFIILPSGRVISPYTASCCFEGIEGIVEYRLVQETRSNFNIQLVLREVREDDLLAQLSDRFKKEFGEDIVIDIEVVDAIPRDGKLRAVTSRCLPRERFFS